MEINYLAMNSSDVGSTKRNQTVYTSELTDDVIAE